MNPIPLSRVSATNTRFVLVVALLFGLVLPLGTARAATAVVDPPQFLLTWGSHGSGDGQFDQPKGVAVDSAGNVYVVDQNNHRVQKFDGNGNFIAKWGSFGAGPGQFSSPIGITVDGAGAVYVADRSNNRIQVFDSSGALLRMWGTAGIGDSEFLGPWDVAVDGAGNVYVTDNGNSRVQKFDRNGAFLLWWGAEANGTPVVGTGDGEFQGPRDLTVDGAGNVYVADTNNNRIQVFDGNGVFLRKWGTAGSGEGEFNAPVGVAVDGAGNVYVADQGNHRLQMFDSSGAFVTKWGTRGAGNGQFDFPKFVALDAAGDIYVSDDGTNHRMQKFGPATFLTPVEAVAGVIDDVEDLVDAGGLNKGQSNSLIAKLDNVASKIEQGKTGAAINGLEAFINQVSAYIKTGKLSPSEGQAMIDRAEAIIAALGG